MKSSLLTVIALTFALATWSAPRVLADDSTTTTSSSTTTSDTSSTPKKHHHHKKCCDKTKCDTNAAPENK